MLRTLPFSLSLTCTVVGWASFSPSVAVVDGRRFRPTSGHLQSTSAWEEEITMRTDDEMSVQEPETTHVSVAHPSASETIPSDVPVASVGPKNSVQTTSMRRILFKRDRVELPKRTRGDEDDHSAFPLIIMI